MSAQPGEGATARTMLVAPSLAIPSPAAVGPRRLALRVTLQGLLLGLLLATVLAVGAVDFVSSGQTVEDLELQLIRAGSQAAAKDIEASFVPGLRALQELRLRAFHVVGGEDFTAARFHRGQLLLDVGDLAHAEIFEHVMQQVRRLAARQVELSVE